MTEFTLKRKETETLRINIGDDSFVLPLQGCMTFAEAKLIGTSDGMYSYLKKTVPEHIFDSLTVDEYNAIVDAWNKESLKASGKTLGE